MGNNISSRLLAQIENFQWQQYCQDQLCHTNAQYNGYTTTSKSSEPSCMHRNSSYLRRYGIFDLTYSTGFYDISSTFFPTLSQLPSFSTSESTESLLTQAAAGATMVSMVGLSLLLYKNVTVVRTIVNAGCQLLQPCVHGTLYDRIISTNIYSFYSQSKNEAPFMDIRPNDHISATGIAL